MWKSEEFARAVGDRIRQFREAQGWSQEDLAVKVGADRSSICRYENGRVIPNNFHLVRLAEALDVSTDELLGGPSRGLYERLEYFLLPIPFRYRGLLRRLNLSFLKIHGIDDRSLRSIPPRSSTKKEDAE